VGVTSRPLGGQDAPRENLPPVGRAGCPSGDLPPVGRAGCHVRGLFVNKKSFISRRGAFRGLRKIFRPPPLDGRNVASRPLNCSKPALFSNLNFFNPFLKKIPCWPPRDLGGTHATPPRGSRRRKCGSPRHGPSGAAALHGPRGTGWTCGQAAKKQEPKT
jgi:hypothetical protein